MDGRDEDRWTGRDKKDVRKQNKVQRSKENLTILLSFVQFVPFRNYANSDPAKLAADVLAELPDQVLAYMAMTKQKPKPRVRVQQGPPPPGVQPKQAPMPNNPQVHIPGRVLGR